MVTISTFSLSLIIVVNWFYFEYISRQTVTDGSAATATQTSTQQLSDLYYGQIPRKNVIGLAKKLSSIKEFAYFVLFMKPDAKRKLIHRNELTAEQLLKDYQDLYNVPKEERGDLFIRWKDNVEHFEANKIKLHKIKTNIIEFRLR
jgi:hypothetical protein